MEGLASDQALLLIASQLSPQDILSTCQTDHKMSQICKQKTFLETLIRHFFPYRTVDKLNLYSEFVRLANTVTVYVTHASRYDWKTIQTRFGEIHSPAYSQNIAYLTSLYPESNWDEDYAKITINGSPFTEEVKLWVMMHEFNSDVKSIMDYSDDESPKTWVYRNRTEAIESSANQIYEPLLQALEDLTDDDKSIDDVAAEMHMPTPFTLRSLISAFEEYGVVSYKFNDGLRSEVFSIRELLFTQERIDEDDEEDE